jgi:hypothetical protein
MGHYVIETLENWSKDAAEQRKKVYDFVGLNPIKKQLMHRSAAVAPTWFEQCKEFLETPRLGQSIVHKDQVNFMDAYQSWQDFFNDLYSALVKSLVVMVFSCTYTGSMLYHAVLSLGYFLKGQKDVAMVQGLLALQYFFTMLAYNFLTSLYLVVIGQVLSICSRLIIKCLKFHILEMIACFF